MTAREQVRWVRDSALNTIVARGTIEAVSQVRAIAAAHPELEWMPRVVAEAETNLRRVAWQPTTTIQLRRLRDDVGSALIRHEDDLGALTLRTLADIAARLLDPPSEAQLLWDSHSMRPKNEEEISDYISNRLRDRLTERHVVVNREVEVRRSQPTGFGERTDVQVQAVSLDGNERITLPIEVKGAWNKDLLTAMDTQRVKR